MRENGVKTPTGKEDEKGEKGEGWGGGKEIKTSAGLGGFNLRSQNGFEARRNYP